MLAWVKADTPPGLKECGNSLSDGTANVCGDGTTFYYCTKTGGSNITILKLTSNEATEYCAEIKETSYYYFEVSNNGDTTTKLTDSVTTPANLVVYYCNDTKCERKYGHFKIGDNYYTVSETESKALDGSGYYLINANTDEFIVCSSGQSCSTFTITDGYFMNSDNEVYLCASSGLSCTKQNSLPTECRGNANKIINVSGTLKFCNTVTSTPLAFTSTTQYNLFEGVGDNDKYPTITSGTKIILLKIEQYSITQDKSGGIFIANGDKNFLYSAGDGTLYSCASTGVCTTVTLAKSNIGYYKNGDTAHSSAIPYIKCYETSQSGTYKCEAIANPTSITSCSDSSIGQIIKDGGFCLNSSKMVTFGETETTYLLNYHKDSKFSSIIGEEGKYGLVTINSNSIFINTSCG